MAVPREIDDSRPAERTPSPPRLLLMAAVLGAVYLALPWLMYGGASVSVWFLVAAAATGAGGGWAVGVAGARGSQDGRPTPRRARSVPAFIVATGGAGLVLGRVLDDGVVPWALLVMVGLTTGLATHVWAKAREADGRAGGQPAAS
jgi:hypothetical protein